MKNRMLPIIGFVAAIVLAGVVLFPSNHALAGKESKKGSYHSYHGHGYGHGSHGDLFLRYSKELELTDKQVEKIKEIKKETQEQRLKWMHELFDLKKDLAKEAHEDKPSRKTLKKLADKMGSLKGKLIHLQSTSVMDAKDVLTKEQKAKLKTLFADQDSHGEKKVKCAKCEGEGCPACQEKEGKCDKCGKEGCPGCDKMKHECKKCGKDKD